MTFTQDYTMKIKTGTLFNLKNSWESYRLIKDKLGLYNFKTFRYSKWCIYTTDEHEIF